MDCLLIATSKGNNVTELEVNAESEIPIALTANNINTNITIIQVSTENTNVNNAPVSSSDGDYEPPGLPHKTTITADVSKYPDSHVSVTKTIKQHEYKSNVQIIPSNSNNNRNSNANNVSSNTIQVMGDSTTMVGGSNHYTTPVKSQQNMSAEVGSTTTTIDEHSKITTVHVAGTDNIYGTCFTPLSSTSKQHKTTPKMPKKIILSANTSGVTSITVNNTTTEKTESTRASRLCGGNTEQDLNTTIEPTAITANATTSLLSRNNPLHYEKVFLSTNSSPNSSDSFVGVQPTTSSSSNTSPLSPKLNSPRHRQSKHRIREEISVESPILSNGLEKKGKTQTKANSTEQNHKSPGQTATTQLQNLEQSISFNNQSSPVTGRRYVSPTTSRPTQPSRPPFLLTRGLTEAVITSRPSRKDFYFLNKLSAAKTKSSQLSTSSNANIRSNTSNNNEHSSSGSTSVTTSQLPIAAQMGINRTSSEALEQRRRSSSTSDAHSQRHSRGTNNNDPSIRINSGTSGVGQLRQPPQPFRLTENILGASSSPSNMTPHNTASPSKRMTLREQQVMQLRREIMHPGGVRLQLRRKDCIGSIAWVEAFGAIW